MDDHKLIEHEQMFARLDERVKTIFKLISEINEKQKGIEALTLELAKLTLQMENHRKLYEEIQQSVEQQKEKPGKRWELLITGVISAAVSYLVQMIFK